MTGARVCKIRVAGEMDSEFVTQGKLIGKNKIKDLLRAVGVPEREIWLLLF